MDRDTRPTDARQRIAAAIALALCTAGCGGKDTVQVSQGTTQSPAGLFSVSMEGSSALRNLVTIGALFAIGQSGQGSESRAQVVPPADPSRRVAEQDCTRPIEDWSANLRCR